MKLRKLPKLMAQFVHQISLATIQILNFNIGRLDESRKETAPEGVRRDLFEAMKEVAISGQGPREQTPSMGCSIKWL